MEAKDRLAIPPQPMPEQAPSERIGNLREVPLGFTPETAVVEARRCLQCRKAFCTEGCPVGVDIPGFLEAVERGDFAAGIGIIRRRNALHAVCGRVCPQEQQCQLACTVGKFHHDPGKSVSIRPISRVRSPCPGSRSMLIPARTRATPSMFFSTTSVWCATGWRSCA